MEPTPSDSPEKITNITLPVNSSTTGGFRTDSDPAFDQTLVVKMPGTGMTVFNRYKLQRILGRGGMGVVWLADDLKLERPVALKFLPSLIGLDPAAVKELKTETRRGLELSHPHIVRIYDFVDDEDAAAISMEFVDGKTLSELRMSAENGVFTTEDISRWLLGVCDALDYAHFQRKVVHRDLKPANIMIAGTDRVAKVADFGIARSLSDTMSRLSAANLGTSGTLPYMSPQQAMGERPLPTDDVYSLGATLFELLAGKPPFYRGDLPMQIRSKTAPSIMERRQELEISAAEIVPKAWEDAIAACLSKDPTQRPSCAGLLAEMLGLKPSTMSARTMSFATPPAAVKPARAVPAWITAAAAAVVIGGPAMWYVNSQKEPAAKVVEKAPSAPVEKPKPAPKPEPAVTKTETPKSTPAPAPSPAKPTPAPEAAKPAPVVAATTPPTPAPVTLPAAPAPTPPAPVSPAPAGVVMPAGLPAATSAAITIAATPPPGTAPAAAVPGVVVMPPPASTSLPLPAGTVLPPDVAAQLSTQPLVADPPTGFWTVEQMFPTLPFANYSATGKRYLLFRTQTLLKEKGLYTSTIDGKEGKGTHTGIQIFQAKSGLHPTGMLDVPTLAALQLSTELDNLAWVPPAGVSGSRGGYRRAPGGGRYTGQEQEEDGPSFLERTGGKLKGIFGN